MPCWCCTEPERIVDLQHRLVTETLGIKHLHDILGISMGGMNAWQWAEAYPDKMDGVIPVVSLPILVSGRNLLWRRMVIDTIRSDPDWKSGDYTTALAELLVESGRLTEKVPTPLLSTFRPSLRS